MSVVQLLALGLVMVGATAVVLTRDHTRQALGLGGYGMALAVLFLTFDAPGVALAEVAVSGLIIPLLVLLALARIRATEHE